MQGSAIHAHEGDFGAHWDRIARVSGISLSSFSTVAISAEDLVVCAIHMTLAGKKEMISLMVER